MEPKDFCKKYRSEYVPKLKFYLKNMNESLISSVLGNGIFCLGIIGSVNGLNAYNGFISCVGAGTFGLSWYLRSFYEKKFDKLSDRLDEKIDTLLKGGVVEDD